MIILKPDNGFVIPVEYMSNDKLFSKGLENINFQEKSQVINLDTGKEIRNSLFRDDNSAIDNEIVRDRLLIDDGEKEENSNIISAIIDDKYNSNKDGRGMLIFDNEDNIEIDEIDSIKLDDARRNLRKAIEVEIEKVGKLVLDDGEIGINSDASVKVTGADVQIDDRNTDELEENIVIDDTREKVE